MEVKEEQGKDKKKTAGIVLLIILILLGVVCAIHIVYRDLRIDKTTKVDTYGAVWNANTPIDLDSLETIDLGKDFVEKPYIFETEGVIGKQKAEITVLAYKDTVEDGVLVKREYFKIKGLDTISKEFDIETIKSTLSKNDLVKGKFESKVKTLDKKSVPEEYTLVLYSKLLI